jgi:hypothetical protein
MQFSFGIMSFNGILNCDVLMFFMRHYNDLKSWTPMTCIGYMFVGLAHQGKDIMFRFTIKYNSLRVFDP